jgi:hypothetical protein
MLSAGSRRPAFPHFYTRDDELGAALEAIDQIQRTGAWQEFAGRRSTVT